MGKELNNWARYSSLGIEMVVIVGAFVFFGIKLDERNTLTFPLWTVVLSISGIVIALMRLWRETQIDEPDKKPDKEKSTDGESPDTIS